MSSPAEILDRLVKELKTLEIEALKIQNEYQTYHANVAEELKKILVGAGVFNEINALEVQREEVRKKAEEEINRHRATAQDLHKIREYLISQILLNQKPAATEEKTDQEIPKIVDA